MITTLTSIVSGIELLTELTAACIGLMALDKLATLIRLTYKAGRLTGHAWRTYVVPAILWAADGISWCLAQVDWEEAKQTLLAFVALLITTAQLIHERWVAWHDVQPVQLAPAVNPLFDVATELQSMSCRQLRVQFGLTQRCSKYQLIAAAIAQ